MYIFIPGEETPSQFWVSAGLNWKLKITRRRKGLRNSGRVLMDGKYRMAVVI
jgi:hypothetical protein